MLPASSWPISETVAACRPSFAKAMAVLTAPPPVEMIYRDLGAVFVGQVRLLALIVLDAHQVRLVAGDEDVLGGAADGDDVRCGHEGSGIAP
jgi:hypothetical protein